MEGSQEFFSPTIGKGFLQAWLCWFCDAQAELLIHPLAGQKLPTFVLGPTSGAVPFARCFCSLACSPKRVHRFQSPFQEKEVSHVFP